MADARGRPTRYFEAVYRGMGPATLRRSNQRAVLTMISTDPGCSNADIARKTGLAPQSVSAVLADLDAQGLLTRGKAKPGGGRGQPATPLYVNPTGAYAIGVEIGWRRLEVVLVNIVTEVRHRERVSFDYPDAANIFQMLDGMVSRARAAVEAGANIVGVGLAMPEGIGDPAALIAPPAGQTELWARLDAPAELARLTGLDVLRVNDGNAACWAEFVAMPAPRPGNFAYLLIDEFVAAGIVSEDRLWQGANLGAMLVDDGAGAPRFAHETASLTALRQRLSAVGLELSAVTASKPKAAAERVLAEWIDEAALVLAEVLLNTRTVFDYTFAVIDAELPATVVDRLIGQLGARLAQIPSLEPSKPEIRPGHLQRSAAAQGAAFIRMYQRYFSRELAHMED